MSSSHPLPLTMFKAKNQENFLKHRQKNANFVFYFSIVQFLNKRKENTNNKKTRNSNKNKNYKRVKSTYIQAQLLLHNIIAVTSRTKIQKLNDKKYRKVM